MFGSLLCCSRKLLPFISCSNHTLLLIEGFFGLQMVIVWLPLVSWSCEVNVVLSAITIYLNPLRISLQDIYNIQEQIQVFRNPNRKFVLDFS